MFSCKGIEVFRVAEGEAYTLLLFYRAACLRRHLEQAEVRDLLQAYGYPCDEGLDVCLAHLCLRMQLQKSFPHEIGLFLGYPVADVVGFITHKGQDFAIVGIGRYMRTKERRGRCSTAMRTARRTSARASSRAVRSRISSKPFESEEADILL